MKAIRIIAGLSLFSALMACDCDNSLAGPHCMSGCSCDGSSPHSIVWGDHTGPCCKNKKPNKCESWDTFRDKDDRNISTKIVKDDFDLVIASLNEKGDDYQEFNGTVCSVVIDSGGNEISSWAKNSFRDDNTSDQTDEGNPTFNIDKARKLAKIHIEWIKDEDKDCPLDTKTSETNSTDNFSIKPLKFNISNINEGFSGEDFNITFKALNNDNNPTTDYNETNGTTFSVIASEIKDGCKNGELDGDINFKNGEVNATLNYDETGEIDINITDSNIKCENRFAGIDCKDKNVSGNWNSEEDTKITETSQKVIIKPYDINLTSSISNVEWVYMDNNLTNHNIEINLTLTAYSKDGKVLEDYNSTCYANDVNLSFDSNISNLDEFNTIYISDVNKTDTNFTNLTLESNWTILKDKFKNGEANLTINFDINRSHSNPISVVDLGIKDINITTPNLAKNENNSSVNKTISFYYARFLPSDFDVLNKEKITKNMPVIVYDKTSNHFTNKKLVDWYLLKDDTKLVEILGTNRNYKYNSDENVSDFDVDIELDDEYNVSIDNKDKNQFVVIHYTIPSYLWYSKYSEYNDSNQSGCFSHYCSEYHYRDDYNQYDVGSGEFKGSESNTSHNREKSVGVRIFR